MSFLTPLYIKKNSLSNSSAITFHQRRFDAINLASRRRWPVNEGSRETHQPRTQRYTKKSISSHIRIRPKIVLVVYPWLWFSDANIPIIDGRFFPPNFPPALAPMLHFYFSTVENSNNENKRRWRSGKKELPKLVYFPSWLELMVTPVSFPCVFAFFRPQTRTHDSSRKSPANRRGTWD